MAVHDLRHYPCPLHNKWTALKCTISKYTNGSMWFGTPFISCSPLTKLPSLRAFWHELRQNLSHWNKVNDYKKALQTLRSPTQGFNRTSLNQGQMWHKNWHEIPTEELLCRELRVLYCSVSEQNTSLVKVQENFLLQGTWSRQWSDCISLYTGNF